MNLINALEKTGFAQAMTQKHFYQARLEFTNGQCTIWTYAGQNAGEFSTLLKKETINLYDDEDGRNRGYNVLPWHSA
jgi:hypothetical protein